MPEQNTRRTRRPICTVLRASASFIGKQGFSYTPAVSAQSVGALAIHMQLLSIPPGACAKVHKHEAYETAIYVLSGEKAMYYGEQLEHHLAIRAGEFLYIPANVPHQPYNASSTEPCVAVIARTDPNEHESVVLLPKLEALCS